ncbi:MAG TPA: hypothetical protein VNB23_16980 [Ramlibacter sp.]|nr:hypothetical protein [Ramlibacter sp.]
MDEPSSTELLLLACELAVQVECRPQRRDGTDAAVYASSGTTLARRIQAGVQCEASCHGMATQAGSFPAPFRWDVSMQVGAARKTHYRVWVRESPEQLEVLWLAREKARQLRESLPHHQRRKKPWGPL